MSNMLTRTRETPAISFTGDAVRAFMPHRGRMLLIDCGEMASLEDQAVVCTKYVSQSDPLLEGHFVGRPVFPQALVIEALAQASGFMMHLFRLLERRPDMLALIKRGEDLNGVAPSVMTVLAESRIRQYGLVFPGQQLTLKSRIRMKRTDMTSFIVSGFVGERLVADGNLLLAFPPYGPAMGASS
jgi:3-hydroxyacyl-[acyl-carrier-protein] dehydratase